MYQLCLFSCPMDRSSDQRYMMRCLQLAAEAGGNAAPNPLVGAALVYEGRIIGEGFHRQFGQPHAEVNCFDSVSEEDRAFIREATLYVSLEPCAHYGKTPPCALRIIEEGVRKVVVANRDPFEAVNGKGIELLRDAGVIVETGLLEKEASWLNRRFFTLHTRQRPYIILKWAQTESGFFAPADRSRMQISNTLTRSLNDIWRSKESAIMVGTRTALNDNPRLQSYSGKSPLRVALDRNLILPSSHYLLDKSSVTWIVNQQFSSTDGLLQYIRADFGSQLLTDICRRLAEASCSSLIVEGGVTLLQSFLDLGLWDEIRMFETPDIEAAGVSAPNLGAVVPTARFEVGNNSVVYYTHPQNPYSPTTLALSTLPL